MDRETHNCYWAGAGIAVGFRASAQDPGTRTLTFKELERDGTFAHIRDTRPKSQRMNATGDAIVFTNPLADAAGARMLVRATRGEAGCG